LAWPVSVPVNGTVVLWISRSHPPANYGHKVLNEFLTHPRTNRTRLINAGNTRSVKTYFRNPISRAHDLLFSMRSWFSRQTHMKVETLR
jgi:hypothetical protein